MIAQYLYECEGEVEHYTCEIKGTKEQEEYAKWLWGVTKDLSDAFFRDYGTQSIENVLRHEYLYSEGEVSQILAAYPNLVSEDVLTAYDECVSKLRELGMEVNYICTDCDEVDVWTSTGVY